MYPCHGKNMYLLSSSWLLGNLVSNAWGHAGSWKSCKSSLVLSSKFSTTIFFFFNSQDQLKREQPDKTDCGSVWLKSYIYPILVPSGLFFCFDSWQKNLQAQALHPTCLHANGSYIMSPSHGKLCLMSRSSLFGKSVVLLWGSYFFLSWNILLGKLNL